MMPPRGRPPKNADDTDEIIFFGEVDREGHRLDGRILSTYPAWYFETQKQNLIDSIEQKEQALKLGLVHRTEIEITKRNLEREKERLQLIEDSKPRIGKYKDKLKKTYDELGEEIRGQMPTRDDMMRGFASPQKELRTMTTPTIKLDPEIAEACNIRLEKGKATREQASKAWKIIGKVLGENTNTETLRRTSMTGVYRGDVPFHRLIEESGG